MVKHVNLEVCGKESVVACLKVGTTIIYSSIRPRNTCAGTVQIYCGLAGAVIEARTL